MPRQRERIKAAKLRTIEAMKGLVEKTDNQKNLPQLAEFYEAVFKAKGGSNEVAKLIWETFDSASNTQQVRLLSSLLVGIKDLYDRGLTKNVEDMDPALMTEEMIDSELANFVGDLVTDGDEDGEEADG